MKEKRKQFIHRRGAHGKLQYIANNGTQQQAAVTTPPISSPLPSALKRQMECQSPSDGEKGFHMHSNETPDVVCLTVKQVAAKLGTSTVYVWDAAKTNERFPKPFKLSPLTTRWFQHEVDAYLLSLPRGVAHG